jgi:hypothetical protein
MDEAEREGRETADENIMDSPGVDTMSDDGTIDGNDHLIDPVLSYRHGPPPPYSMTLGGRPRPRSMHEMPNRSSFHVDLPLMSSDMMQPVGPWTPGAVTPELRAQHGPPQLDLYRQDPADFDMSRRIPRASRPGGVFSEFSAAAALERARSTSRTPSRRHTLVESSDGLIPPLRSTPLYAAPQPQTLDMLQEQQGLYVPGPRLTPQVNLQPGTHHLWNLGMRGAADVRQTYLRPEHDFSTFEANHEAIMATIPASQSSSRQASRSNSPFAGRVGSRSRLSNLWSGIRANYATPFTYAEAAARGLRGSRSRDRSRIEEEERREAVLRAMAEADSEQQLRPNLQRGNTDRTNDLPLLHPDLIERLPVQIPTTAPLTLVDPVGDRYGTPGTPPIEENQDVDMTNN